MKKNILLLLFQAIAIFSFAQPEKTRQLFLSFESSRAKNIIPELVLNKKKLQPSMENVFLISKESLKAPKNKLLVTYPDHISLWLDVDSIFNTHEGTQDIHISGIQLRHKEDAAYFYRNSEMGYKSSPEKLILMNNCDSTRVKKVIDSLGLFIEKRYKYCTGTDRDSYNQCPFDTYILMKKNRSAFDRNNCKELMLLRQLFQTNTSIGPLIRQEIEYSQREGALDNKLEVSWNLDTPYEKIKEILKQMKLEEYSRLYADNKHRYQTVKASSATGEGITDIARRLKTFKEVKYVSNEIILMDCPTN